MCRLCQDIRFMIMHKLFNNSLKILCEVWFLKKKKKIFKEFGEVVVLQLLVLI